MQTEEVSLSAAEKEARVNEMESEFMKRRKLIISGLPPESNHEVNSYSVTSVHKQKISFLRNSCKLDTL